jgi:hypothetical protein
MLSHVRPGIPTTTGCPTMKSARFPLLAALAVLSAAGCDRPTQALGTASSIIVIASDTVWSAIGERVESALEPRIHTVRDERTFEVTHVAPSDPTWTELRNFRQIVAIGTAGDAWVQPVLDAGGQAVADGDTRVVRANDVWVRNQLVLAVVLPQPDATDDVDPALSHVVRPSAHPQRVLAARRREPSVRPDPAHAGAGDAGARADGPRLHVRRVGVPQRREGGHQADPRHGGVRRAGRPAGEDGAAPGEGRPEDKYYHLVLLRATWRATATWSG